MVAHTDNRADRGMVLVVEDDGVLATSLRVLLRYVGLEVRTARGLEEAKRQLTPEVSCILLDLMLPDGDGCDVIRYAREKRIDARVVVVTGTSDPGRLRQMNQLQPERVLRKPADYTELLEAVQSQGDSD